MSELIRLTVERSTKYSTISLIVAEDPQLSWGAKGLHTYLISRPPGWEIRYTDLLKRAKNKSTNLKRLIRDLKDTGYLSIKPIQGEGGKFVGTSWTVREQATPQVQKPSRGLSTGRKNRQTENVAGINYQGSIDLKDTTTTVVEKFSNFKNIIPIPLNEVEIQQLAKTCGGEDCLYFAADVMNFQRSHGTKIKKGEKEYLFSLARAAAEGKLITPEGYISPWERVGKAREAEEREKKIQEQEKEKAEKIAEAEKKFSLLPAEDQHQYLSAAGKKISKITQLPDAIRAEAISLFREGRAV